MPRASAAAAAATAEQVLECATALFTTRGFAAVSLDDVARSAGVTRGAVYHHYRNKTGLLLGVVTRLQSGIADAVVTAAESAGPDPRDQLRAGCHAFLDAITAAPAAGVLLLDAPAVIGWQQWRELDEQHSAAHLREALEAVGVEADLLEALTVQLSGAMNEAALWIAQQPADDPAHAAGRAPAAHRALDRLIDAGLP